MNEKDKAEMKELIEKLQEVDFAMITTRGKNGILHSRPMSTQEVKEGSDVLYFFTYEDSLKMDELEDYPQVNCSYSYPKKNLFISISGEGKLSKDKNKMKELWSPPLKMYFPDGLETKGIALLVVTIKEAEWWDADRTGLENLYEGVKSLVLGKEANPGEHEYLNVEGPSSRGSK